MHARFVYNTTCKVSDCIQSEEVRHPCTLSHYFYIPYPRCLIKLYIEYGFNYMKGARMSYLLWYLIISSRSDCWECRDLHLSCLITTVCGLPSRAYRLYNCCSFFLLMMLHITVRQYTNSVSNKDRSQEHLRSTRLWEDTCSLRDSKTSQVNLHS